MPVYEFTCELCGQFEAWRAAADAASAIACPACGAPGRRRFTPPGVSRTPAAIRAARDREEASAHQPQVVAGPHGRPMPWAGAHSHAPPWAVGH